MDSIQGQIHYILYGLEDQGAQWSEVKELLRAAYDAGFARGRAIRSNSGPEFPTFEDWWYNGG